MLKNIYITFVFLSYATINFAQSFSVVAADTIAYGNPGDVIFCSDSIKNNSATGFYVDVIRVINDTAPNWQTSYCLDVCYPPSADSARFYLLPSSYQNILLDFYSDTTPDTSMVLMKFKNVTNPSNTAYLKLWGITSKGLGVADIPSKNEYVNIYPSPIRSGMPFTLEVGKLYEEKDLSLILYDLTGKKIEEICGLRSGNNNLTINFEPGIFFYSLLSSGKLVANGKIAVAGK